MIKSLCLILFNICFTWSCGSDQINTENPPPQEDKGELINIDVNTVYQTIEHFGASDAWSCQFVGNNWPLEKKDAIADLLFSKEVDASNNPKGIGLSLWRFNIGAGSAEQGSLSGINDEWRRAESFLQSDGTYNWDKQAGQVWFAQAAKSRGVEKLLIFSNSPPVYITKNGKAHTTNGESNLVPEQFESFATYLTTVIEGLQNKGLSVDYISPMNEPQWDWKDGQEGTSFLNNEIAEIVRKLNQELESKSVSTLIDVAEAGKINYLYENADKFGRGNQIQDFFNSGSQNYIGDLSHYGHAISGHGYFTTSPFSEAITMRKNLLQAIKNIPNLNFWMSEYCILGDNGGEIDGNTRDLGINSALYVARTIYNDLVNSQATAWHWWLAVSPYDYKDGLVYIDYNKNNGQFYESKMLWALGNYSRFIRPGYQRISMSSIQIGDNNKNFLFSGYKNPTTDELVVVLVNSGINSREINLQSQNHPLKSRKAYITSATKSLELFDLTESTNITIPGNSIVTIIYQKS
ncbi:MAG: glycoside hydrolase [Flavobacteriales bacterium]